MILESLHVQNFRSLLNATLTFNDLTVLVGPNGAGKSAFLMAIRLLYDPTIALDDTEFFNRDTSNPIKIDGTFCSLTTAETRYLGRYVHEGRVIVRREFVWSNGRIEAKGSADYPSTDELERISRMAAVADKKVAYNELVTPVNSAYRDMPQLWRTNDQFETDKAAWILAHPDRCSLVPDAEFFAPNGKGTAYVQDRWSILYIPAVQDPMDVAQDNRGSVLTKLVDMVARKAFTADTSFNKLSSELKRQYSDYLRGHETSLETLSQDVSRNLEALVPGSSLKLTWDTSRNLDVRLPVASPELSEDGFLSPIAHVGSGLQRACTISLLQQLATSSEVRPADSGATERVSSSQEPPSYMIIVEEPELYQHPDRQRHLARVFSQLADHPVAGVSSATQVCYCTHSPLFVQVDRFDCVRLLRKVTGSVNNTPKQTAVSYATIADICRRVSRGDDQHQCNLMVSKLRTIMTPWVNEGFFARLVVLVEGEDDRGAILGTATRLGHDLEAKDIAVIPCLGKNNLDRPWAVFTALGIPTYVVWDNDENLCKNEISHDCHQCTQLDLLGRSLKSRCAACTSTNEHLLEILGETRVCWPGVRVADKYACFKTNLEETLKEELTAPVYEELLEIATRDLDIFGLEHAIKNPTVIESVLARAAERGSSCATLEQIVDRVIQLAS